MLRVLLLTAAALGVDTGPAGDVQGLLNDLRRDKVSMCSEPSVKSDQFHTAV